MGDLHTATTPRPPPPRNEPPSDVDSRRRTRKLFQQIRDLKVGNPTTANLEGELNLEDETGGGDGGEEAVVDDSAPAIHVDTTPRPKLTKHSRSGSKVSLRKRKSKRSILKKASPRGLQKQKGPL